MSEPTHRPTEHEIRTTAIERGLLARKKRARDAWTVEHPDGRVSAALTAAEMMAALEPAGGRRQSVVVAGEDFGNHRECRWTHGAGSRSVAEMWRDLRRAHDSTAPIPIALRPEVVAELNRRGA